jgi:hypothetical protein
MRIAADMLLGASSVRGTQGTMRAFDPASCPTLLLDALRDANSLALWRCAMASGCVFDRTLGRRPFH